MKMQQMVRQVRAHVLETRQAVAALLHHSTCRRWAMGLVAIMTMFAIAEPALAALPTALDPGGESAAAGDYIALIQAYWKKGVAVLVLIVGALAFLSVGGGAVAKFNEFRNGKAELGDLSIYAVLGVVLLVTVVYLLTTADGVIT